MYSKRTFAYITVYLLFVLAVWMAFTFAPSPRIVQVEWQEGILDLTGADFDGAIYYYLDNRWDNHPEQLYTPADFDGENAPTPTPMVFDDFRRVQYATHRMQLRLPPGCVYALSMRSSDYAMRLFIDGEEAAVVGNPGDSAESQVPGVAEVTCFFQPTGEVTTLLVQASNWVHREGAFAPNFYIGTAENIGAHNRYTQMMTFLITGVLLTAFLYHLGLFVLNRRRIATLVFSLGCLLLAAMGSNVYALFLPRASWYTMFRLEYIIHFLTFVVLTLFLWLLFPRLLLRPIVWLYWCLAGLYILTTFLFPPRIYSRLILGFEIASAGMIVYVLIRLGMQLREGKLQNMLAFAGMLLVCLFGLSDLLYKVRFVIVLPMAGHLFSTPIAMTFFVFCYGLVVALEYAETERAMVLAMESEQRLAADNAALGRLSRMKSDLMATVSHETRTPLAVLSGYAELISMELRQKGVDAQTTRDLDRIADETQRIAAIMEEMQNVTRARENADQRAWIQLSDVITQAARLYAPILTRKNTGLLVELPEDLPLVFANAGELTQVLFNLLQNAKNHTENGSVTLLAEAEENGIAITVTDTGDGIPPDLLPSIFDRGVSGEANGTGIGLAVCKEIIGGHGGTIAIRNNPGGGTVVRITLPNHKEDGHGHASDGLIGGGQ